MLRLIFEQVKQYTRERKSKCEGPAWQDEQFVQSPPVLITGVDTAFKRHLEIEEVGIWSFHTDMGGGGVGCGG
jgi:hypothetical protein